MSKRVDRELKYAVAGFGVWVWERPGYRFDFDRREYLWNGKAIILTNTEELYLYDRLVLKKLRCECFAPQTMYQLQRKFGKAFLSEIFAPGKKKRRGPGRKTDLEYELEANWFTKDGKPRFRR